MENYFVEIVKYGEPENVVVKTMGPMSERKAELVDRGASRNLNHDVYYTRIVRETGESNAESM